MVFMNLNLGIGLENASYREARVVASEAKMILIVVF